uniref:Uncharacterized protein n=1 Tax=Solanum tuberosum TaxID=4113 RepID=M1CW90_SOLTU
MPRGRASAKELSQFKARNSIPCEDIETSSVSSHKRKSQEKEAHFEEQPTEIQNSNPKRLAVNRASRYSSCLNPIIGTIEGNNIPNSITNGPDHISQIVESPQTCDEKHYGNKGKETADTFKGKLCHSP